MRPAWLEVNLDVLAHNFHLLKERAGGAQIIGVVKANAYGHGAVEVGKELLRLGAWGLAVATPQEARELREAGVVGRILLLGSLHPEQAQAVVELELIPSISTLESAEALNALGKPIPVHLEFDTGLGRSGFPVEEAHLVQERFGRYENLLIQGIYSHFADAEEDAHRTREQIGRFMEVRRVFGPGYFYHLCNTAGTLGFGGCGLSAVRPGIGLYGLLPGWGLRPIARLLAKPTQVRKLPAGRRIGYGGLYTTQGEEWIATLPVGYADGIPRLVFNRATVRYHPPSGAEPLACPVVGRVSMDQITVRLPEEVGLDQVFEVATADHNPTSSLWGWAELTGTVSYEPAVRLSRRLNRVYLRGGVEVARVG
ncbi:MAG: alanine racemase [Meiothermus sp.]|uniref:alanine racemase n=1 Tax=Meiothermus sp. TaxID=1955249 RepID=UPI0025D30B0F|nr:alanine racemase [Meiothermus sp.]MCS7058769.1 alanine racemase [Meiothermus sp.]MCS7195388.1 alanine racemase [Meiothermus sp.]MCX7740115.1 alanine racemase [Meiothermus sp.]MDW8091011.1 alanine racemase [Meiothermus sp.]MDW8482244.1 alanine racemase [Meiothermus sp.]